MKLSTSRIFGGLSSGSTRFLRIGLFLLFAILSQLKASNSYSQSSVINLSMRDVTIEQVLDQIEKITDFRFLFTDKAVDTSRKVTIDVDSKPIAETLAMLFKNSGIDFKIVDHQVILSSHLSGKAADSRSKTVSGTILDAAGEPIVGANVVEKGTTNGTITDVDGRFSLAVASGATLQVSYIGYVTQEVSVSDVEGALTLKSYTTLKSPCTFCVCRQSPNVSV